MHPSSPRCCAHHHPFVAFSRSDAGARNLTLTASAIAEVIVGQQTLVDKLLNALLCNGHVLLEGVPGVAKTMMVNSLAQALAVSRCYAYFSYLQVLFLVQLHTFSYF